MTNIEWPGCTPCIFDYSTGQVLIDWCSWYMTDIMYNCLFKSLFAKENWMESTCINLRHEDVIYFYRFFLASNIIASCLLNHFIVDNWILPEDGVSQHITLTIIFFCFCALVPLVYKH